MQKAPYLFNVNFIHSHGRNDFRYPVPKSHNTLNMLRFISEEKKHTQRADCTVAIYEILIKTAESMKST